MKLFQPLYYLLLERLGMHPGDDVEFEITLERRGGEEILVLKPRKKAAAAAAPA